MTQNKVKSNPKTRRKGKNAYNRENINTRDTERARQMTRRLIKNLIEKIGKEMIIQGKKKKKN